MNTDSGTTSDNSVFANANAFGTSQTRGTLYEIGTLSHRKNIKIHGVPILVDK